MRPVGTYLYGRRMYDTMAPWETDPALAAQSELMADFANVWQAADKVLYSTTLDAVSTAKTRLERNFDPASVRDMKASATSDLTVGGPHLAAHALKAGLVVSAICSSVPSSSAEASPRCPATPAPTSSCWTITDSATVSYTSATASRLERPRPPTSTGTRSARAPSECDHGGIGTYALPEPAVGSTRADRYRGSRADGAADVCTVGP